MKFYFCEGCGVRITDADLDDGLGRNKKLKGVYCSQCAVGVTTLEQLPMTESKARELLAEAEPPTHPPHARPAPGPQPAAQRRSSKAIVPAASRRGTKPSRSSLKTPARLETRTVAIPALVLILLLALVFGIEDRAPKPSNKASETPRRSAPSQSTRPSSDKSKQAPSIAEPAPGKPSRIVPVQLQSTRKQTETAPTVSNTPQSESRQSQPNLKTAQVPAQAVAPPKAPSPPAEQVPPSPLPLSPGYTKKGGFLIEVFASPACRKLFQSTLATTLQWKWAGNHVLGAPRDHKGPIGLRVTGMAIPPQNGRYVFEFRAKDSGQLLLDDALIAATHTGRTRVRSEPIPLKGGHAYRIRVLVINEQDDVAAALSWSRDNGPFDPVPCSLSEKELPQQQIIGRLQSRWRVDYGLADQPEKVLETQFQWASRNDWGTSRPLPSVAGEDYWARIEGDITPPKTERYVFHLKAGGRAEMYLDGVSILETNSEAVAASTPVLLEAKKKYAVRVEYSKGKAPAFWDLRWTSPGIEEPALLNTVEKGAIKERGSLKDGLRARFYSTKRLGGGKPLEFMGELCLNSLNFNWPGKPPVKGMGIDGFAVDFTGWLDVPKDDEYTFSFSFWHSDSYFFFLDHILYQQGSVRDEKRTHSAGPIALKKGYYPFRLYFYHYNHGAFLKTSWRGKQTPEGPLPVLRPSAVPARHKQIQRLNYGLVAEYYMLNENTLLQKTLEGTLDFHWGGLAPLGECPSDRFRIKWTGGLRPEVRGNYQFRLHTDHKATFKLQGVKVLECEKTEKESYPIPLAAKRIYLMEVEYAHYHQVATMELRWKPPGKKDYEPIPPMAFVLPPQARRMVE